MAQVFYDKAAVQLEYDGVSETFLASDCSINFNNSLQPLYIIGNKGSLGHTPAGPRAGDISFNFLTSITGVPTGSYSASAGNLVNYLASGIKHSIGSTASGIIVKCGGLSGKGFLNSYAFNIASNSVSTSSASFSFFGGFDDTNGLPISGRISGTSTPFPNAGGTQVATGVAHGVNTPLTTLQTTISASDSATEVGTVYSADYSISFSHNPIYKIGQEFPTLTLYSNASESINVAEDIFNSGLSYTGDAVSPMLTLKGVDNTEGFMEVQMISGQQVSTSASVGLDDIIRSQKTLTAAY